MVQQGHLALSACLGWVFTGKNGIWAGLSADLWAKKSMNLVQFGLDLVLPGGF